MIKHAVHNGLIKHSPEYTMIKFKKIVTLIGKQN